MARRDGRTAGAGRRWCATHGNNIITRGLAWCGRKETRRRTTVYDSNGVFHGVPTARGWQHRSGPSSARHSTCQSAVCARHSPPTPFHSDAVFAISGRVRAHRPRSCHRGRRSVAVTVRSECSASLPRYQRRTSVSSFRYQPLSFTRLVVRGGSRAPSDYARRAAAPCARHSAESAEPRASPRSRRVERAPRDTGFRNCDIENVSKPFVFNTIISRKIAWLSTSAGSSDRIPGTPRLRRSSQPARLRFFVITNTCGIFST